MRFTHDLLRDLTHSALICHNLLQTKTNLLCLFFLPAPPETDLKLIGRGIVGRFVQVIYLLDEDGAVYIIHAMPLNDRQKKRLRRRLR